MSPGQTGRTPGGVRQNSLCLLVFFFPHSGDPKHPPRLQRLAFEPSLDPIGPAKEPDLGQTLLWGPGQVWDEGWGQSRFSWRSPSRTKNSALAKKVDLTKLRVTWFHSKEPSVTIRFRLCIHDPRRGESRAAIVGL